ncbi:hypothetical protein [Listeria welshimeri]|uniref:hypothetical protein n=1 Tax=Listeria welshimeri TaxID=1643 RepID=UPI0016275959|nr:hypothetical protein [Listeria welshimeri]MBC1342329.1 hypothetical protein [Listeria welshimeri]MBC1350738.1 hypothetical protein [Listeria welshimeri]MBC1705833.1 hypothetical protein [Listeria welshimeri]MBF2342550.1 hypothetical protein [Listeria welshimeri]
MKQTNYKLVLHLSHIEVECPVCGGETMFHDGSGIDLDDIYFEQKSNISVLCSDCDNEIILGKFDTVVE